MGENYPPQNSQHPLASFSLPCVPRVFFTQFLDLVGTQPLGGAAALVLQHIVFTYFLWS